MHTLIANFLGNLTCRKLLALSALNCTILLLLLTLGMHNFTEIRYFSELTVQNNTNNSILEHLDKSYL